VPLRSDIEVAIIRQLLQRPMTYADLKATCTPSGDRGSLQFEDDNVYLQTMEAIADHAVHFVTTTWMTKDLKRKYTVIPSLEV